MFVAVLLLVAAQAEFVIRTDHSVAADLHHYARRHHNFTTLMRAVSDLHKTVVWFVVMALVAGWLLLRRLQRLALFVVVTVLGSSLLNNLVELSSTGPGRTCPTRWRWPAASPSPAGTPRPPSSATECCSRSSCRSSPAAGGGWPSRWRRLLVLLVGFARISLGVHYLSDVIGAFLIGTVWLIASSALSTPGGARPASGSPTWTRAGARHGERLKP